MKGKLSGFAWWWGSSGNKSHPVGQKKPNAWGLYDMHGNVEEWCLDWYDFDYQGGNVVDPKGPDSGKNRVFRGSYWGGTEWSCRSAIRNYSWPGHASGQLGFRVALSSVSSE